MFTALSAVFFAFELLAASGIELGHVTALFTFSAFQNDRFPHGFNSRGQGSEFADSAPSLFLESPSEMNERNRATGTLGWRSSSLTPHP